jgi:hypothetical protein
VSTDGVPYALEPSAKADGTSAELFVGVMAFVAMLEGNEAVFPFSLSQGAERLEPDRPYTAMDGAGNPDVVVT